MQKRTQKKIKSVFVLPSSSQTHIHPTYYVLVITLDILVFFPLTIKFFHVIKIYPNIILN